MTVKELVDSLAHLPGETIIKEFFVEDSDEAIIFSDETKIVQVIPDEKWVLIAVEE